MKIWRLNILIILFCVFNSCNEKEDLVKPKTNREFLIEGNWLLQEETLNGNDIFTKRDSCKRDDKITYRFDHLYFYKDAGMVCSPSGDSTDNWFLINNQNLLIENQDTFKIEKISTTLLQLSSTKNNSTILKVYINENE